MLVKACEIFQPHAERGRILAYLLMGKLHSGVIQLKFIGDFDWINIWCCSKNTSAVTQICMLAYGVGWRYLGQTNFIQVSSIFQHFSYTNTSFFVFFLLKRMNIPTHERTHICRFRYMSFPTERVCHHIIVIIIFCCS